SSGPNLHLRIKVGNESVDPQKFLLNYGSIAKQNAASDAATERRQITPEKQKKYEAAYPSFYKRWKEQGYTDEKIKELWERAGNPPVEAGITSADVTPPFKKQ
ncbi:MAG: hypothetical protein IJ597_01090, partial [Synergistaceae bacterium]|nr:hypothetical protein [Synergistaceae bacterium]